jgi:hypothetical protein
VLGVYYFASRGGIGLSAPVLGFIADRCGFATSFTAAGAVMTAVALVCTFFLLRNRG